MACDKPTGDCTNVSPCGSGCGCSDCSSTDPILPRCQDVSLVPGTYTHATIVVNNNGCISAVSSGEPEPYTPDDCCGQQTVSSKLQAGIAAVMQSIAPMPSTVAPVSDYTLETTVMELNNRVVALEARIAALEAK